MILVFVDLLKFFDEKSEDCLKRLEVMFEDPTSDISVEHFEVLVKSFHEDFTVVL